MVRKIEGLNCVKKIRRTWMLGFVQTVSVLCDFGPSLFGYSCMYKNKREQMSWHVYEFGNNLMKMCFDTKQK